MEQYRVFNIEKETCNYEYDITVETNDKGHKVHTLYRSGADSWSHNTKNEKILTIIDTGNSMVIPSLKISESVGYDTFAELFILMSFINKTESMPFFQGKIEKVEPENIMHI